MPNTLFRRNLSNAPSDLTQMRINLIFLWMASRAYDQATVSRGREMDVYAPQE
jgi:hypothetical protein